MGGRGRGQKYLRGVDIMEDTMHATRTHLDVIKKDTVARFLSRLRT